MNLFRLRGLSYGDRTTAQHKCPKCRSHGCGCKYRAHHDVLEVYCFDCGFKWDIEPATPGRVDLLANPAPTKPHTP